MASSVPLRLIDGIEKKTVTDFEVRTVRCGPGEKKSEDRNLQYGRRREMIYCVPDEFGKLFLHVRTECLMIK